MAGEIQVTLRAILPVGQGGVGVFLAHGAKTVVIVVGDDVAAAIARAARGVRMPRPMTHDLLASVLAGLGAKLDKVVISEVVDGTFHARLYLLQEQEGNRNWVEVDARSSDAIALAVGAKCPMFVAEKVWSQCEDVSPVLDQLKHKADDAPADGGKEFS